ncbi:unnamed protein product [Moneuplotes crassus]|uniref:Uncharacterized protein n=1 Tax=Euplotes crassus TaxID=5936 RepID=A0AAD1XMK0_EUPCR|nr:unnamed protein product [Moneuplotes crassus]
MDKMSSSLFSPKQEKTHIMLAQDGERMVKREIWNISLYYFLENSNWRSVSIVENQWNVSLDLRIPDSSSIMKTFCLLEGAKFNEVCFFFIDNKKFKESIYCFLDQTIRIKKLYLKFTDKKLSKANMHCLIRNAHKIQELVLFDGVELENKPLSRLFHAFAHLQEINLCRCSFHNSCNEKIKVDPTSIFTIKLLELQFVEGSKQSLGSVIKSLSSNPSILENLVTFYYNEGIVGHKPGLSKISVKTLLEKCGYKATVRSIKPMTFKSAKSGSIFKNV